MKKIFISLSLLSIACLISYCSNNALAKINDGYFWTEISSKEKQAYITGIIDGAITIGVEIQFYTKDSSIKKQISTVLENYDLKEQFTIPQVIAGLDQFYNDYANKKISIDSALVIVIKMLRGFPEAELQKDIELLRQISSKVT